MERLDRALIKSNFKFPGDLKIGCTEEFPEKVLQFGEGNFLRGFVDWMFNALNREGLFNGRVVVAQPIEQGLADRINEQDGLYTLFLRGVQNGEIIESKELITSISRGLNIYSDYEEYLKLAQSPHIRVIVSNTTEAGIAYKADDKLEDTPPASFPAKLTVFLYKRFKFYNGDITRGIIIIPCELIDRNGDNLKKIVIRYANEWGLGSDFISWLESGNYFLNTLVDRIVTGYPKDEVHKMKEQLGYEDDLLDTGEIFHLWVIEGDKRFAEELPFAKAGLNVIWTDDLTPYRTRKVRILNGAHTMTVPAAYLYGKETVKECMDDSLIRTYMEKGIFEEIIPTLDLPESELRGFADAVSERFENPFIKHYLLSIALNSISKFKTRVLPSLLEYVNRKGKLPNMLSFSLAALILFYRGNEIRENSLIGLRDGVEYKIYDDMPVLELFKALWTDFDGTEEKSRLLVEKLLDRSDIWGTNLNEINGFAKLVSEYLFNMIAYGIDKALNEVIS